MKATQDAPARTTQDSVEAAARSRLEQIGYRSLKSVSCRFRQGTLYLRGRVPTFYQKQLAQESIRTLRNVNQVVNEIKVCW